MGIKEDFKSLEDLLGLCYKYKVFALPVGRSFSKINGFILKEDMEKVFSATYEKTPSVREFIRKNTKNISQDEIDKYFPHDGNFPIVHPDGYIISFWNKKMIFGKKEEKDSSYCWFISLILENFPYGILVVDPKGRILIYNEAFLDIFPFLKGKNLLENSIERWFPDIIPDDKKEYRVLLKMERQNIALHLVPLRERGKFVGFLMIFRVIQS